MGALAADRKTLTMTQAAIAANLHQTLDVLALLTTEVALDHDLAVDSIAKPRDLVLSQVLDTGIGVHAGLCAQLGSSGTTDAIDIRKADLNALLTRKVDTKDTGQRSLLS